MQFDNVDIILSNSSIAQPKSDNLIRNGGFELPMVQYSDAFLTVPTDTYLPYWDVSGTVDVVQAVACEWSRYEGRNALDLNGLVAGTISQTVNVTVGAVYNLSYAMTENYLSIYTKTFEVLLNGVTFVTESVIHSPTRNSTDSEWISRWYATPPVTSPQLTVTFNSTTINSHSYQGPGLDDVRLVLLFNASATSSATASASPTASPAASAEGNLLRNGGFEAPSLAYATTTTLAFWRVVQYNIDLQDNSVWDSWEGRQYIDLDGNLATGRGAIEQTVNVTVGARYRLSYAFSENIGPYAYNRSMAVYVNNELVAVESTHNALRSGRNMMWEVRSYTTPPVTTDTLTIRFQSTCYESVGRGILLDDVRLVLVASPTALPSPPQSASCTLYTCPFYLRETQCQPDLRYRTWAVPPDDVGYTNQNTFLSLSNVSAWAFRLLRGSPCYGMSYDRLLVVGTGRVVNHNYLWLKNWFPPEYCPNTDDEGQMYDGAWRFVPAAEGNRSIAGFQPGSGGLYYIYNDWAGGTTVDMYAGSTSALAIAHPQNPWGAMWAVEWADTSSPPVFDAGCVSSTTTPSVSQTISPNFSASASSTASASWTASPNFSVLSTVAASASSSVSGSASASTAASPSTSGSCTATSTALVTPTAVAWPSPAVDDNSAIVIDDAGGEGGPPWVAFSVSTSQMLLQANLSRAAAVEGPPTCRGESGNSSTRLLVRPASPSSSGSGASAVYHFLASALFRRDALVDAEERSSIRCSFTVRTSGPPPYLLTASITRPVTVRRRPWPLIQDVLVHSDDGGSLTSALCASGSGSASLSTSVGLTFAMLDDAVALQAALDRVGLVSLIRSCGASVDSALTSSADFASALPRAFQVRAYGDARVTIVAGILNAVGASIAGPVAFIPQHTVSVGGVPCRIIWSSSKLIHCLLPAFEEVCGDPATAGPCGSLPIALTSSYQQSLSSVGSAVVYNTTFSCPPLCPGALPDMLPYISSVSSEGYWPSLNNGSSTSSYVGLPIWQGQAYSGGQQQLVLASSNQLARMFATSGLQLLPPRCNSSSAPDPSSGVCTDHTNNRSYECLYGSGDSCMRCPIGGLCPGGYRMQSRPGFYLPNEGARTPVRCIEPAAERCAGWDAGSGTTLCGVGYKAGSPGCLRCAEHYFVDLDGSCTRCPSTAGLSINAALVPLVSFAGGIIAFVAVNYAAVHLVVYLRGGTIKGGLGRAAQLTVWMFSLLQLVAQVCKTAAPGLPPELRRLIRFLDVFTFSGLVPPAACVPGAHPLSSLTNEAIIALVVLLLVPVSTWLASRAKIEPSGYLEGLDDGSDAAPIVVTHGQNHAGFVHRSPTPLAKRAASAEQHSTATGRGGENGKN